VTHNHGVSKQYNFKSNIKKIPKCGSYTAGDGTTLSLRFRYARATMLFNNVTFHLQEFYKPFGIKYKGLKLLDVAQTNIALHFNEVAEFIDEALAGGGKIFSIYIWDKMHGCVAIIATQSGLLCSTGGLSAFEAVS
jgi:hypothetical protein